MGLTVGALLGEADGSGVGLPAVYVGASVGDTVGALEGEALGFGVGLFATYVGTSVGDTVGSVLGDAVGLGVAEATDSNVRAIDVAPVPGALSTVTTLVAELTETTVVKEAMYWPLTELPTWMLSVDATEIEVLPATVLPIVTVVKTAV